MVYTLSSLLYSHCAMYYVLCFNQLITQFICYLKNCLRMTHKWTGIKAGSARGIFNANSNGIGVNNN